MKISEEARRNGVAASPAPADRQGYRWSWLRRASSAPGSPSTLVFRGWSRNFCLEKVKAALEQREAERTYGIGDPDLTPVPWSAPACGIDLGAKTFATISDDDGAVTELHAPKPLKAALRRLCEANKAVARKEPGSGSSHLQGGLVRIERVAG